VELAASDVTLIVTNVPHADQAAELRVDRTHLALAEEQMVHRTERVVRDLRDQGVSLRDIATMVGVSFQRVHQLLR
jgi:DNA-directed RNA polymerase specialized sigma subunit